MTFQLSPLTIVSFFQALLAECGFILLLAVGSLLLPAPVQQGYKLNGLLLFALTIAAALAGELTGLISLAGIPQQLPALLLAANVLAFSASAVLMLQSRD